MDAVVGWLRQQRTLVSMVFDASAWVISYAAFTWLRFDTDATAVPWSQTVLLGLATVVIYVAIGWQVKLHQGRARVASLEEMLLLGSAVAMAGGTVFVLNLIGQWIPRSVPAGATVCTLVLVAWARASWRRLSERDAESAKGDGATRVLVVGAGEAGRELIGSMFRDPERRWLPVGFLDDDPRKRNRRIRQVPVIGTTEQLMEKALERSVDTVILALPSASAEVIERLRLAALDAHLKVKVLPATTELLYDEVGIRIRDLRDINLADVLGRKQLDTDVASIAEYLAGRKVLVTGAGGSIGSELCRQILGYQPAELMMLDRDESALHALQLSIHGRALLETDDLILCDIRDDKQVREVFTARRPDVVFHAAALKHLPMLEQYPSEAVKTNITGTRNVLEAAEAAGVRRFVNISTDKAANPISVLGYSKRISERLTAQQAASSAGTYLSVRFGNVLGSRGSVLISMAKQIADGGPVTVTDPQVTRYFMTTEEACQLVIQAAAIGEAGEVLVLDMGKPVRILDVAHQLIEQAGTPVRIDYTGLRVGEKLHEELFGDDEKDHAQRRHPLIWHVPVPPVSTDEVAGIPAFGDPEVVRAALAGLCEVQSVIGSLRDASSWT